MSVPDDVAVGLRPDPRTVGPVTITDVVRFAGASGDFNPLHHDPEAARAAGFDGPIAMGQYTASLLAAWVTDWCGVANLRHFEIRFTAPLMLGDEVTLAGEVTEVGPAEIALSLTAKGRDTTVATGSARVARRPTS